MKQKFSLSWKKSIQPRKQRKYRHNAPLHIKQGFMRAHLSKELHKKYTTRALTLRKGDRIKIMRGKFKGKTGKVERIGLKKQKVFITGIELTKKEGTKALHPLKPSNLLIQELNLDDKKRRDKVKSFERK